MNCWYAIATPTTSHTGAIAVVELGGDVAEALKRLRIAPVDVGAARLRLWPDVDSIVLGMLSPTHAMLFPHAGPAVARRVIAALNAAGLTHTQERTPAQRFPEAANDLEARMLDALRRAQSPLAIDLLLDQPRRWSLAERDPSLVLPPEDAARLNFLIVPPRVVALGPPNIGKSSLLNALAGRGVAIVADVPGTTRDHVGVALNLAGLVVNYIDTPGIGPLRATAFPEQDDLDREAQRAALEVAATADLLLLCADPMTAFLLSPPGVPTTLRVCLRSDLGRVHPEADIAVSIRNNTGLDLLTAALRDALIPPRLLADSRAWAF